jgi:hypothetical protein
MVVMKERELQGLVVGILKLRHVRMTVFFGSCAKIIYPRKVKFRMKAFNNFSPRFLKCISEYKLKVKDAITLLDREQGGSQNVTEHDVTLHRFIYFFQI